MRHRVKGRRLGRSAAHRKALGTNLLRGLIEHHRITTTVAKAKEYRPMAERLVTLAREKNLANVRRALRVVPDRGLVGHLFDVIAPHFKDRPGGYTRILRLSRNRVGDDGHMAILEFIDLPRPEEQVPDEAAKPAAKSARPAAAAGAKAPAKKKG